jgi:hypothetical protein
VCRVHSVHVPVTFKWFPYSVLFLSVRCACSLTVRWWRRRGASTRSCRRCGAGWWTGARRAKWRPTGSRRSSTAGTFSAASWPDKASRCCTMTLYFKTVLEHRPFVGVKMATAAPRSGRIKETHCLTMTWYFKQHAVPHKTLAKCRRQRRVVAGQRISLPRRDAVPFGGF